MALFTTALVAVGGLVGGAGCGDLVRKVVASQLPDLPDAAAWSDVPLADASQPDGLSPGDTPAAPDGRADGEGLACSTDEDCDSLDDCCYEGWCLNRTCQVRYKEACCTYVGACATQSTLQQATCVETCVPGGCHARLKLPEQDCGRTLWAWTGQAAAVPFDVLDGAPEDTVTWHPSVRHVLARPGGRGAPVSMHQVSMYAGDTRCPTYHTGPLDAACVPLNPASAAPVSLRLVTPQLALPWAVPAVAEVWLWASLEALPDDGSPAYDGVELRLRREDGAELALWSSRDNPLPDARWAPVLVDLSPYAGQLASLVVSFDTRDGLDNDHEGVYLGSLVVRAACASERTCPAPTPCTGGAMTPIGGLDDALCVPTPASPETACVTCLRRADCPDSPPGRPQDACDQARCQGGRCVWEHALTASCCTPQDAWPGPPSFEAPLDGWALSPSPTAGAASAWSRSTLLAHEGAWALRFGALTPEGQPAQGLLAPADEPASGEAWAPPTVVPREVPALVFWVWLSTEWDAAPGGVNPLGIDLLRVAVRRVGADLPPAVIWDSMALGGTTQGGWVRVEVALDAFAGLPVQVGFLFDTGDAMANDGGVFVDDPALVRRCPAPR